MSGIVRDPRLLLAALLVVALVAGARRLDPEIHFYDEGVYVATARALAAGEGYRNPTLPGTPPQAKYPPGLPLLLSVVWRVFPAFPDNVLPMKVLVMLSGLGMLGLAWAWRRAGPPATAVDAFALVALLGLCPLLVVFSTLATSDVPYAFFSLAAVYLYERERAAMLPVLALAALAFLMRTAGLFLLGAIVVHLLLERRIGWAAVAALVATAVVLPWLAWSASASAAYAVYPPGVRGNYIGYASAIPSASSLPHLSAVVVVNLRLLLATWGLFVLPWAPSKVAMVVVVAALGALIVLERPRRASLAAVYCALYLPSLLLIPYPDTGRYALPVIPFLVAWSIGGVRALVRGRAGTLAVVGLAIAGLAADLRLAVRPRGDPATLAGFHTMAGWIEENVPRDAILVGDWDAGYHLFTGRQAVRLSVNDNLKIYYTDAVATDFPEARELAQSFERLGACYLVRDPMIGGREAVFFTRLLEAVMAASSRPFEPVYASADRRFEIYRRVDCPASPG